MDNGNSLSRFNDDRQAPADTGRAQRGRGPEGALGTLAKSPAPARQANDLGQFVHFGSSGYLDPESGEYLPVQSPRDPVSVRLERFVLQSIARVLLPDFRVSCCLRSLQDRAGAVSVHVSADRRRAVYGGLQTCGSVWVCPVCAAKVSERRRVELDRAATEWRSRGGELALLTLTHPHESDDSLSDLLRAEQAAMSAFWGHFSVRRALRDVGCVGHVRGWEVTHGRFAHANGWHPHFHVLLFVRAGVDLDALRSGLYPYWLSACRRAGLRDPSLARGLRVDAGTRAAEYVTKWGADEARAGEAAQRWGVACELAKSHIKRGSAGQAETPFDLLRSVHVGGDSGARELFCEYARAFRGKRQLVWSRGLRDLLALGEDLTDEQIAALHEDDLALLGRLSPEDWRSVLRADVRGELLELARSGGWEAVQRLLLSL